jgi:secreted PhoX family phosphatase
MTTAHDLAIGYDDGDIDTNRTANPHLNDLVVERYSRRQTLMGGLGAMTTAAFGSGLLAACGKDADEGVGAAPVVVTAGQSVSTTAGRRVTLTPQASDNATTTSFTQVSGPTVTTTTSSSGISFVAPAVSAATPIVFEFTASNGKDTSRATSTVTVSPAELGFTAIAKNKEDLVTVPTGYAVGVLYRLGDPIAANVSPYANDGGDTNFAQRAGDHHDGMSYYGLAASGATPALSNSRGLLVMNHENITQSYLHPNGPTSTNGVRPEAEVIKEIEAHGVSVVEVSRAANNGAWSYVQSSSLNRRITPNFETAFSGPVKGNAALVTAYSTDGTKGRGTINNCSDGQMPWNTYLTCEENWAGYFRRGADSGSRTAAQNRSLARYGISEGRSGNYGWASVVPSTAGDTRYARWNATVSGASAAADFRNEPNQFGWVVEIDPYDPSATPRKRTALGRMNHEGCCIGRVVAGVKPAFYMGDDAQNEYIYKFVSNTAWTAADASASNRLAIGDKYLDSGTLYVAKFNADGTGQWLPLVFGQGPLTAANTTYPFADQADVLVNTRLAADALGATRMDRPEWTAVNPANGEMYCTLTNNSSRTPATTDAANPRAYIDYKVDGRTPSKGDVNGEVIRLRESGDTTEATGFTWDIYVFGAGADLDPANINLSGLDQTNDFSSPDGLWFGAATNPSGQINPLLWIQTDDGNYTDVTNNQMLAALPGRVADGGTKTITNSLNGATSTVTTRVGAAPGTKLRRFLVGPKECEITGITSTPDGESLFVNIQHPGENGSPSDITSSWPATQAGQQGTSRPRSATIVITKTDGSGVVGL